VKTTGLRPPPPFLVQPELRGIPLLTAAPLWEPLRVIGRLGGMSLDRTTRRAPLVVVTGVLLAAVLSACSAPAERTATAAGFVGYNWAVVSISHEGMTTSVPGTYSVSLQFTPDGHFGANEPVNYHSGQYRVTPDGFTLSGLSATAAGYAGHDPVIVLAVSAVSAFGNEAPVLAAVNGNALTVTVSGYTLVAEKDGRQADF
jgi:hypothetical protein